MNTGASAHKERVERYVSEAERRAYYAPSALHSLWTLTHVWAALGLAFGVIWLLRDAPLGLQIAAAPVLMVFIGTRINALAVQVHEGAHGLLLRNRRWNNCLCNAAAGYWILNDVASYWRMHREHHAHLHGAEDPDKDLYAIPGSRSALFRALAEDLIWITAAKRIARYRREQTGSIGHAIGKLSAQCAVLAVFVACFGVVPGTTFFFVYWVVPLFSIFPALIRIRTVTEHFSDDLGGANPAAFVSRTSVSGFMEEYLIGAQMEFHLEHHLFPRIPYHQLKRFHRELRQRGYFDGLESAPDALSGGYWAFWRRLIFEKKSALERAA